MCRARCGIELWEGQDAPVVRRVGRRQIVTDEAVPPLGMALRLGRHACDADEMMVGCRWDADGEHKEWAVALVGCNR